VPIKRAAAGMVALVVGLAACGGGDADTARLESGAAAIPADDVGLGEALAQVRGHHRASLEAYRQRDYKTAAQHAFHPVHEIMDSIASDLDPADAEELEGLLDESAKAVADRVPVSHVESLYDSAASATESALQSAVGERAADPAYQASVVASLLTTAAHEYEEAAPEGKLVLALEYQDGYAFVREARALFDAIPAAGGSSEIEAQFEALERALPSLEPPRRLASTGVVSRAVETAAAELESSYGATLASEGDPDEVAENIESLLDEVVAAYESGETEEAAELAAEAYLENYELIEAEVIEHAEEVNAELEPLLGAELRRQIEAGVSPDEIESLVSQAKQLLSEAVRALE
jgi:hypothetical protein